MSETFGLPPEVREAAPQETRTSLTPLTELDPPIPDTAGLIAEPNVRTQEISVIPSADPGSATREITRDPLPSLPPRLSEPMETFRALQKWEGFVIELRADTFVARLGPLIGTGNDLEAEIYLEEVDAEERALIEPGAVFYWTIGYLESPSGRRRESIIRFRRLPTWTEDEIARAREEIANLQSLLDAR